jgi:hypothetical protein
LTVLLLLSLLLLLQVGSQALSGAANNHIVLAQADSAVAYSQAERA